MNKQEAAKLLSLIKLSYPTAYRDIDKETANATVTMWQMSFPDVPYPIMEQAFNHFRMASKFPPTVAEMVEELRKIYNQAVEGALVRKSMGELEAVAQYRLVMAYTARFKDTDNLVGLNMGSIIGRIGGESDVQRLGASRDWMDRENRLPFLDAGAGSPQR